MDKVHARKYDRCEHYSNCTNLFNIQAEYLSKVKRNHLAIPGALSSPLQLRETYDLSRPATLQEYMLGEGQDYTELILNLQKAGKLTDQELLSKLPLYVSLNGLASGEKYQTAQIYEFNEK